MTVYIINGVDLQGSEYNELKLLVEAENNGSDPRAIAFSHLNPTGDRYEFDEIHLEIYRGLLSVGLIDAINASNGLEFYGLTQKGRDFIKDYADLVVKNEREEKSRRRHDYKVAAFGIVGGLFSGMLGTLLIHFLQGAISAG